MKPSSEKKLVRFLSKTPSHNTSRKYISYCKRSASYCEVDTSNYDKSDGPKRKDIAREKKKASESFSDACKSESIDVITNEKLSRPTF